MTLQEALASGEAFTRPGFDGQYITSEDLGDDFSLTALDITATDYTLESDALEVTEADLVAAWESARVGLNSVKSASESTLFKKFVSALKA